MKINIEKGVPIPDIRNTHAAEFIDGLKALEIGDSFYTDDSKSVANALTYGRRIGIKVTTRKLVTGGWRVWRIEP